MTDATIHGIEVEVEANAGGAVSAINKLANTLSRFKAAAANIRQVSSELKNLRSSATKSASAISNFAKSFKDTKAGKGLLTFSKALTDTIKAVGKFGLKGLGAGMKGLGFLASLPFKKAIPDITNFTSKIGGVLSGFKRILGYRIIRRIIREISEAFQEGTKNLYEWSRAVGGAMIKGKTFAQTMDGIASSSAYFKNSIGAAVAPLISALAPAIDFVIDKVVALINVINQLFALLGGGGSWNKAIKKANEYEEAAGGAGGAAKKALEYLAPFDELNVLPDTKSGGGGGGGTDYAGMFEETTEFAEGLKDFADSIREAIEAGNWKDLGVLLGQKINEIVESLGGEGGVIEKAGKKVGGFINAWFTTKYWTLDTINFTNIGGKIAEFFNNAIGQIDFEIIGRSLVQRFSKIADLVIGAVEETDWKTVGSSIGNFIKGAFNEAADWLKKTDFGELFESIITGIFDFIKGLDTGELVLNILDFLGAVVGAVVEGIGTLLIDVAEAIANPDTWKLVEAWLKDLPAKFKNAGIKAINALAQPITDGINQLIDKINNSKLAEYLGWHIDPINFQLIPEIPKDELTRNYDQAKKEIEAQSKQNPVTVSTEAKVTTVTDKIPKSEKNIPVFGLLKSVTPKYSEPGMSKDKRTISTIGQIRSVSRDYSAPGMAKDKRMIQSIADMKTVQDSLSANSKIFDTKAKFSTAQNALPGGSTTFSSKAKFDSAQNALPGGSTTFSSIANINRYLIDKGIADGGNMRINATANVTRVTGMTAQVEAAGGALFGGSWHDIPQYAGGTARAGSLFIAGEAGPEIVGHIGGRTEVLNQSQLAATMYSAVRSAMSGIAFHVFAAAPSSYDGSDGSGDDDALYRAFRRALDETDFGGDIELDGQTLYRAMVNRNRQNKRVTGVNALA